MFMWVLVLWSSTTPGMAVPGDPMPEVWHRLIDQLICELMR
jgi:hypothetical protein